MLCGLHWAHSWILMRFLARKNGCLLRLRGRLLSATSVCERAVNYSAQGLFRAGKALLCLTIVRFGEKCFEIIFIALGLFINQPHLPVDEGKESAGSWWRNSLRFTIEAVKFKWAAGDMTTAAALNKEKITLSHAVCVQICGCEKSTCFRAIALHGPKRRVRTHSPRDFCLNFLDAKSKKRTVERKRWARFLLLCARSSISLSAADRFAARAKFTATQRVLPLEIINFAWA